jgi:hypothetical protein
MSGMGAPFNHRHLTKRPWCPFLYPVCYRIYAFWPAERLWYRPFKKWSPADWQDDKHRSLLWNIGDGSILVAEGVLRSDEIRTAGNLMSAETLL